MEYKIERLTVNDYDELLGMLNTVFHKPEGNTFDVFLPVMWERDDEHMSKHIAIKEDGKISAVVGIYPLPANVCGEKIVFSTIGNVATLPECEGRGMMKALMTRSLEEAKKTGIDIARLAGARQRYNRYGFEHAGAHYLFKLIPKNLIDYYGGKETDGELVYSGSALSGGEGFEKRLEFKQVTLDTPELLDEVMELEKNAPLYAERGDRVQFFKTLSAYKHKIWGALDGDKLVGYMCVTPDNAYIYEHRATDPDTEYQMLLDWLIFGGAKEINIHIAPWETKLSSKLMAICEKWSIYNTSMFHVFSWSKVLNALLKIRSKYTVIPEGSLVIEIEGYGRIELSGDKCTDTDKEPQMTLSQIEATRFILGSMPAASVCELPDDLDVQTIAYIQSVLPLPLWWCNQDRV